ncbi:MAG TPA: molybdopterin cofactor-binding domain-containing protein, partial [Acidimicrobiia bacterium]|nr:molybdopterin cofactor-binding domain-containing protein [Acidimicrobiia bacterium]
MLEAAMATSGSILGNPVLRKEDPGILTGRTEYYDDLKIDGLLHVAFVRSTVAHATIESIDTDDAKDMDGVVAIYTADDVNLNPVHGFMMLPPTMNRPPLAQGKVRFVGDIVAMVVAESKAQAMDAAENVIVDYDPLPAISSIEGATAPDAPVLHEAQGSNVANAMGTGPIEGVLDDADVVITQRVVNQRVAPVPMEPGGIVVVPGDPAGGFTAWIACQGPHGIKTEMAMYLGLDPEVIRARIAAVGGGFGAKQ